jgi:predicted GNAT family acetyltransferase
MDVEITDVQDRRRYELRVDGELAALVTYGKRGSMLALTHTETEPGFEGQGYAKQIVTHILSEAREHGLAVLPFCPFVRQYIADHGEHLELVPERYRENFELAGATQ